MRSFLWQMGQRQVDGDDRGQERDRDGGEGQGESVRDFRLPPCGRDRRLVNFGQHEESWTWTSTDRASSSRYATAATVAVMAAATRN
jgi:hypothetical protein